MDKIKFNKNINLKNNSDIYLKLSDIKNFKPSKSVKANYLKLLKFYTDDSFAGSFTLDRNR